ncbi:MAG: 50S ribosomal protein L25 [Fidelibacterota bacterium]
MATEYKLEVFKREGSGKKFLKALRNDGKVPGIYYSHASKESIPFTMDRKEMLKAMKDEAHVYKVSVGGRLRSVIFKEVQYHPVTDEVIHVDLYGVRMDELIVLSVPLNLIGIPKGVSVDGGHLSHLQQELEIRCLPSDIPPAIEIDVTELRKGESIHVRDLDIPEKVECVTHEDLTVASIIHGMKAEEIELETEEEEDTAFEEEEESTEQTEE